MGILDHDERSILLDGTYFDALHHYLLHQEMTDDLRHLIALAEQRGAERRTRDDGIIAAAQEKADDWNEAREQHKAGRKSKGKAKASTKAKTKRKA